MHAVRLYDKLKHRRWGRFSIMLRGRKWVLEHTNTKTLAAMTECLKSKNLDEKCPKNLEKSSTYDVNTGAERYHRSH